MADIPDALLCGLDAAFPGESGDYTLVEPTPEETARLDEYERTDVNTSEDWYLRGDEPGQNNASD